MDIIVGFTTSLKSNNIFIIHNTYFYKLIRFQRKLILITTIIQSTSKTLSNTVHMHYIEYSNT